MLICSLAPRKVCISSASCVISQPVRMPGMPYVFESDDTLIACGVSVAAQGSISPKVISR